MDFSIISDINFKSGLTQKTIFQEKIIQPAKQEKIFIEKHGTEAIFQKNKSIALANKLCASIFESFKEN